MHCLCLPVAETDTAGDEGVKPEQEELMNQYQVLIDETSLSRN